MKRFGKDEYIESKVSHLTSFQEIIDLYEKENNAMKDINKYLEILSNFNTSNPETILKSNTSLKNMKKELMMALNKENKKT